MGAGEAPVSLAGPKRREASVQRGAVLLRQSGAGQGGKNKKRKGWGASSKSLHYFYFMDFYWGYVRFFDR